MTVVGRREGSAFLRRLAARLVTLDTAAEDGTWIEEVAEHVDCFRTANLPQVGAVLDACLATWCRLNAAQAFWSDARPDDAAAVVAGLGYVLIFCLRRLSSDPSDPAQLSQTLTGALHNLMALPEYQQMGEERFLDTEVSDEQWHSIRVFTAIGVHVAAVAALESCYRANLPDDTYGVIERKAHQCAEMLAQAAIGGHIAIAQTAGRLLVWCHQNWQRIYRDLSPPYNGAHPLGLYSALRLRELSILAARKPAVVRRYGERGVDLRFEQQLALLAASLGAVVIHTRRFQRSVDLVCVAERATIIIEAKTTAHPYSLPPRDSRALAEYIASVKGGLEHGPLPPVELVLIVGPACTSTLSAKLRALGIASRAEVRFVHAGDLASLREHITGYFPLPELIAALQDTSEVVSSDVLSDFVEIWRRKQEAVRHLVDVWLPGSAANRDVCEHHVPRLRSPRDRS